MTHFIDESKDDIVVQSCKEAPAAKERITQLS